MSGGANQHSRDADAKLKRLDIQIARDPTNATWHWRRGVVLAAAADFARAQESFEQAVSLLPRYADAWAALGEVHAHAGKRREAKRAFRHAIDIDPLTGRALAGYRASASWLEFFAWRLKAAAQEYWHKMRRRARCPGADDVLQQAVALANRGHTAAAMDILRSALARCPGHLPLTKLLSACLFVHGNTQQSRKLMRKMTLWWPEDPQAHYAYGTCLATIGDMPASIAALERALTLSPDDNDIRIALAVAGKKPPPAPHLKSVRHLFDSYAERFDKELVDNLNYRVPERLAAIIASSGRVWDRILDVGCGTGLMGANLRPHARHLTGVDLSSQMIEKAKARGVYDAIYKGDCVAFLQQIEGHYDLMVATDVLIYFGDLTDLFRAAKLRLAPGGRFWFSVEARDGDGFSVALSQRYQHSSAYLRTTANAAGLRLAYEQPIDIRLESGKPVRGLLVALESSDGFSGDGDWQFKPGLAHG